MLSQYQQLLAIGLLLISFQVFAQYQQLLAEHQPDLVVKGDNYPPPGFRWQKLIFHGKYSCTYQYPMKSPESLWHSCRQRFIYHNCYVNRLQFAHLIGALKMALLLMLVISFDPWAYIGHEVTPPLSPYYCPGASSYLCTKWQPQVRTIQL